MSRRARVFCLIAILALIPAIFHAAGMLPRETSALIEEKYAGWSGVLRVWVCEGWAENRGLAGWINRAATAFERAHEGVYVQVTPVDAEALAQLPDSGLNPPDLVLFPPGALNPETRLDPETPIRPVALGGYLWAINASLLDRVPADLRDVRLALPADTEQSCYSAALLALCSGSSPESGAPARGGLDLGLETASTPAPAEATPRCILPEGLAASEDAFEQFLSGDAALIPVSLDDIPRLQRRSERGLGPDWQVAAPGNIAFTDQVLFAAAPDTGSERLPLARALLSALLDSDAQRLLPGRGLVPARDVPIDLPANDPICILAAALYTSEVYIPDAFSSARTNVPINPNNAESILADSFVKYEFANE